MKWGRWIALSRWVYARLLYLYPRDHRIEYGPSMLQLFTDQCRSAHQEAGIWGLAVLWRRILIDVCSSSLHEHLTSPRLLWGLLEAVPGEPLPWKGVLLALIPGLVFVAGQIAQLSGTDWFFLMTYRAAYLLIIPVLLTWLLTRKVPIWGLIPIGLLYNTIWWVVNRLRLGLLSYSTPVWSRVTRLISRSDADMREAVVSVGVLAALLLLIVWMARSRWMTRRSWAWVGAYLLLGAAFTLYSAVSDPTYPDIELSHIYHWNVFVYGGFLLLILFGAALARRHGRLAILLPLGYMLPTILFGRFNASWETPQFMFLVSGSALVFRLLVAVIAPVWILRATPGEAQKRAATLSLLGALAIQAILEVGVSSMRWPLTVGILSSMVLEQLILAAGIFLALGLYQNVALTPPDRQSIALASAT